MSLYIDRPIIQDESAIQVEMCWHPTIHLVALAAYSEEKGGTVDLYDRFGMQVDEGNIPPHQTAQASCLAWHPVRKVLAVGWESGDLYLYADDTCLRVDTTHSASIHLGQWNAGGQILVTADKNGAVVGWRYSSGEQLIMIFHHELKDALTCLTFAAPVRPPGASSSLSSASLDPEASLSGLARAAVAGDERALDLFSSWRPSAEHRASAATKNNAYAGSVRGVIYCLNENGSCMEVLQADGAVKKLLLTTDQELVVVTETMVIGQFKVEADGGVRETSRVKLSTRMKENHLEWMMTEASICLAVSSGDLTVRVWNLKTDENFVLGTSGPVAVGGAGGHFITGLAYSTGKKILAAGTNNGKVLMWQNLSTAAFAQESGWRNLPRSTVEGAVRSVVWDGAGGDVCAINTVRQVYFLHEQPRAVSFYDGVSAVQVSATDVLIDFGIAGSQPLTMPTDVSIEELCLTENALAVYGSGKVLSFQLQAELRHTLMAGDFHLTGSDAMTMFEQSVCTLEGSRINVRSFQGTVKNTLALTEAEGSAGLTMEAAGQQGKFLVVLTKGLVVKIWDVSKREPRLHTHPISLTEKIPGLPVTASKEVHLNASGTLLSVCCAASDSRVHVLDLEANRSCYFNFNSGKTDRDEVAVPPNSAQSTGTDSMSSQKRHQQQHQTRTGRFVVRHAWDSKEGNFLVCQTRPLSETTSEGDSYVSMFFHDEEGLIVHDTCSSGGGNGKLVGVKLPFIHVLQDRLDGDGGEDNSATTAAPAVPAVANHGPSVRKLLLKDFEGLESSDAATRKAVVSFCFYLSVGNMDEAFRAIKAITSKKIWGNLARMCVKSQRLDVATICLGKMEHSRGARAMRKVLSTKASKEVKVAVLAIYLGMQEEAEKILQACGQYEMLNKLYQDSDQWPKALALAEQHDRIHLRSTYYNYAKHLESRMDVRGAVTYYEKSGTARFEVPRLLFDDWNALESYVEHSSDKGLRRWLAQYLESTGEMDAALHYYRVAEDHLSLVRVYCYCDDVATAAKIANESGDRAACYHLARQYENVDDVAAAVHFFTKAAAYSNAIRLCKEHGMADNVWNLALMGSLQDKLEAARYFETGDKPSYEKAVVLYEKAGYFAKALDLAIATNQHGALVTISRRLKETSDPALASRAASFFLENRQYDKAVELFVASKQCRKALELCLQYNIAITEENAEVMSLGPDGKVDTELLNEVASVAYRQGNYHLATKKWTQAGNRLQAMKALLKSGDTDKIIFFANVSRDADIYILAGNYLQTLDWRNDASIMRNIIAFYQKARAFELLGWFYQACADVEVDEYQNYEKALGALGECTKCLERVANEDPKIEDRLRQVGTNIELIRRFVESQASYQRDPRRSVADCHELLKIEGVNAAVRKGDLYGFLIEHYARVKELHSAQQMISELRQEIPNVNLAYYVNTDVLRSLESSLGLRLLPESGEESAVASQDDVVED